MKYRRPWWAVLPLLAPVAIFASLIAGTSGCGGGGGGPAISVVPTPGNVEIAFIGQPPPGFRNVLLNISTVRLNPTANASVNDSHWVTIPVATNASSGMNVANPGDLQVDLNQLQTGATLFNTYGVPVNVYNEAQVVVDVNVPGVLVPVCQPVLSGLEGCINYPMTFPALQEAITFNISGGLNVGKNTLSQLLINLNLQLIQNATSPGGPYVVSVTASQASAGAYLGDVIGTVNTSGTPSGIHLRPLTVSAELAGTSTVVASANVVGGNYTLGLPAAPSGTAYDLFVSGGGFDYDAARGVVVKPGQNTTVDFQVTARTTGAISGTITDQCTGAGIQGATLELLAPPQSSPTDCSASPQNCVVVATASTDNQGNYPLPGTRSIVPAFSQVPTQLPAGTTLGLQISATGYNSMLVQAHASTSGGGGCTNSSSTTDCSQSLETSYITGTLATTGYLPSGTSMQAQVFAENTGTNALVSALTAPAVIRGGTSSVPFTLNVPVGGTFDLFASAIDPYLGAPDPYPGHSIEVVSGVAGPASACATTDIGSAIAPLNCVGHGSVSGSVSNPDLQTTIEVSKNNVQLFGTQPGLLDSGINTNYSFCLPPDSYTLQREEDGSPVGLPQAVTVAQPSPTSTPCPSTCFGNSSSSCPGECTNQVLNPF